MNAKRMAKEANPVNVTNIVIMSISLITIIINSSYCVIVWVRVVLKRTVVGD